MENITQVILPNKTDKCQLLSLIHQVVKESQYILKNVFFHNFWTIYVSLFSLQYNLKNYQVN